MSEQATTEAAEKFNPSEYMSSVSGSPYLEVKWRLVWFRELHPDGKIETELVHHDFERPDPMVVFKATLTTRDGAVATGFGSEEASDFGDYIEKAETKAVGRALAALGFGTQFCDDYDFGAANNRVVDSPVKVGGNGFRSTPAPPADEDGKWHCEDCGREIRGSAKWSAEQLASISARKNAGKVLCYNCSRK